ncbi:MAG: ribonucleotide reductase [Pseudomonadota bacterium]
MTEPVRTRLPDRRLTITDDVAFRHQKYPISVSHDAKGRPLEVFASAKAKGSDVDSWLVDCGILLSLALQYGVPLAALAESLGVSRPDDEPISLLGAVVQKINHEVLFDG